MLELVFNGGEETKKKKKKSNEMMARWEKNGGLALERVFDFITWPAMCRMMNGASWLHPLLATWP